MPKIIASVVLLLLAFSVRLHAQSYDGDFSRLREQQRKAVQAALEPVNRQYAAALDQLLRKAMQAGDLATATKVKEELTRVAPTTAAGAVVPLGDVPESATALIGKWKAHTEDGWSDIEDFKADGTVSQSTHRKNGTWQVQDNALVVTFGKDTQRFPLPINGKTNVGKTGTGNNLRITKLD
jgi:hypothetical protein